MVKRVFSCYLLLLGIVTLCLGAVSCADDKVVVENPRYHAGFYISIGQVGSEKDSRAPSGTGEYNPGSGLENYIDLENDLKIVLFDPDNVFLGEMTNFWVTPVETYDSSKRYYIEASTTVDISNGKFKVLVLANWGTYPQTWTLENVWDQTYNFKSAELSMNNTIPLFGIKEVKLDKIEPFQATNIGTIHLLRAFAKIEVILDDPDDYWHFSKLELTHYNKGGFCAPTNIDSESDYKKDSWTDDYTTWLSIPSDTEIGKDLAFVPTSDNHYVVYVPEYDNNSSSVEQARICVDFEESILGKRYIEIRNPLAGNTVTDFKRNVWYKITIRKQKEQTEMDITVDVIPYHVIDLNPSFGLDE